MKLPLDHRALLSLEFNNVLKEPFNTWVVVAGLVYDNIPSYVLLSFGHIMLSER